MRIKEGKRCILCKKGTFRKKHEDSMTITYKGGECKIENLTYYSCDVCDEGEFYDKEDEKRMNKEWESFKKRKDDPIGKFEISPDHHLDILVTQHVLTPKIKDCAISSVGRRQFTLATGRVIGVLPYASEQKYAFKYVVEGMLADRKDSSFSLDYNWTSFKWYSSFEIDADDGTDLDNGCISDTPAMAICMAGLRACAPDELKKWEEMYPNRGEQYVQKSAYD